MQEETKTFISRVRRQEEQPSSPLSQDLIFAIQKLKSPHHEAAPSRVDLLTYLFNAMVFRRGPPFASSDDTLRILVTALKSIDKSAVKLKLCDMLIDLEIRAWNEVDKSWVVNWPNMKYWLVALVGIVEGWGVGYAVLMGIVRKLTDDKGYENLLTGEIVKAFGLWVQMKPEC